MKSISRRRASRPETRSGPRPAAATGSPNGSAPSNPDRLTFGFTGAGNPGVIDTMFGLALETEWRILGLEGCIYCKGAALDRGRSFTFSMLVPFEQCTIGLGCGDPGTDDDNFFTCGGDGRADWRCGSPPSAWTAFVSRYRASPASRR